jgi:hypothetical protein
MGTPTNTEEMEMSITADTYRANTYGEAAKIATPVNTKELEVLIAQDKVMNDDPNYRMDAGVSIFTAPRKHRLMGRNLRVVRLKDGIPDSDNLIWVPFTTGIFDQNDKSADPGRGTSLSPGSIFAFHSLGKVVRWEAK